MQFSYKNKASWDRNQNQTQYFYILDVISHYWSLIKKIKNSRCSVKSKFTCGASNVSLYAPSTVSSSLSISLSLKDSLVPIDSSSLNILHHSAGTYVSSVIYWTGVSGEHMNDNQPFVSPWRCSRIRSLWCCLRGRLGGAAGPLCHVDSHSAHPRLGRAPVGP